MERPTTTAGQEAGIVIATKVGILFFGVLVQGLLAYTLLPEGRGAYAVCTAFAILIGTFFGLSADKGAQHFVVTKQLSLSQGVILTLVSCLLAGGLAVAAAVPLLGSGLDFFQKADTGSFYLALVLIPLVSWAVALEAQLAGLRRFARLAICALLRPFLIALGLAGFVWGLGLGVEGALMALAVAYAGMIAACLWHLRRHCGLVAELPSAAGFFLIIGYGLRYHLAQMGSYITPYSGILLLGVVAGPADIGIFAAASVLMFQGNIISGAVGTTLYPRVAGNVEKRIELFQLSLRLTCWITGFALLAFLAVSPPLVRLLLSEAFLPVVPLLWLIAPGMLAEAASGILETYFTGANRPGVCSWASWLGLGANVGSFFALYPRLGLAAAALALTIGLVVRGIYLGFMYHRATQTSMRGAWLPRVSDWVYLRTSGRSLLNLMGTDRSMPDSTA